MAYTTALGTGAPFLSLICVTSVPASTLNAVSEAPKQRYNSKTAAESTRCRELPGVGPHVWTLRSEVGDVGNSGIYVNFAPMSSVNRRIARFAVVVWVAPVTAFARPVTACLMARAMAQGERVLEVTAPALSWFLRGPWFRAITGGAGFAAATIGHVIVARDAACMDACRLHEHVHVRQCERWGRCSRSRMSLQACTPHGARVAWKPTIGSTRSSKKPVRQRQRCKRRPGRRPPHIGANPGCRQAEAAS